MHQKVLTHRRLEAALDIILKGGKKGIGDLF